MSASKKPKNRVTCALHDTTLGNLERKVDEVHSRVYDGLPAEIRREVNDEIKSLRNKLWGIVVALLMVFAGLIVEGRVSSNQVMSAIHALDKKLITHMHDAATGVPLLKENP